MKNKKLTCTFLVLLICLCFTSCGNKKASTATKAEQTTQNIEKQVKKEPKKEGKKKTDKDNKENDKKTDKKQTKETDKETDKRQTKEEKKKKEEPATEIATEAVSEADVPAVAAISDNVATVYLGADNQIAVSDLTGWWEVSDTALATKIAELANKMNDTQLQAYFAKNWSSLSQTEQTACSFFCYVGALDDSSLYAAGVPSGAIKDYYEMIDDSAADADDNGYYSDDDIEFDDPDNYDDGDDIEFDDPE